MYTSQQQRKNILYHYKQSLCICEVIGKAGDSLMSQLIKRKKDFFEKGSV